MDDCAATPDMDITTFYKVISARGKIAMREKKAAGEVMHLAPLGYRNVRDEQGRSVIESDPKTYALVQEARRLREEGWSIRKICGEMKRRGLRSKRGKVIGPSSMLKIVAAI